MKKIMAVYDPGADYAERLSDYINRKRQDIFEAQAFTSKELLDEYARANRIDLLLTGERADAEGIAKIPSVRKIYLSEERPAEAEKGREIYKYQSGDDIIREVMAVYCETPGAAEILPGLRKKGKRVIGVYSPVNRCGKTSFALAVGQILAKEERVLFITLDSFSGFSGLINERWKSDLSDLLYYYKQGRYNALRLNSMVRYFGELAWLPPLRFPEDLNQMASSEMAGLIGRILQESEYETIVLDIGEYGRQVLPLLELCQAVYMPVREDTVSKAKLGEFDEYVKDFGKQRLAERFHRINVPAVPGVRRTEQFPQELLWGDMGDFVRRILKGQRGLWES